MAERDKDRDSSITQEADVRNFNFHLFKADNDLFDENKNKISSREQILNATSLDFNTKNRTIDMHISNIRAKIGDDSKNPKYIKSVWGIGYKFVG